MIIRSIADILSDRELNSTTPDTNLRVASQALKDADVGALAVMEDDHLVGILSERDVLRRAVCEGLRIDETKVSDVMTAEPRTISADESLAAAMGAMVDGGFRHLPVIQGDRVAGMLSMRDIPTEYRLMFERYTEAQEGPTVMEGRASVAR